MLSYARRSLYALDPRPYSTPFAHPSSSEGESSRATQFKIRKASPPIHFGDRLQLLGPSGLQEADVGGFCSAAPSIVDGSFRAQSDTGDTVNKDTTFVSLSHRPLDLLTTAR
jgi:hypothetical protein